MNNLNGIVKVFHFQHYLKDADGLCTRLRVSVPKRGGLEFSVDSKAFEKAGWAIPLSDLKLSEVLGKGEFGKCFEMKTST